MVIPQRCVFTHVCSACSDLYRSTTILFISRGSSLHRYNPIVVFPFEDENIVTFGHLQICICLEFQCLINDGNFTEPVQHARSARH